MVFISGEGEGAAKCSAWKAMVLLMLMRWNCGIGVGGVIDVALTLVCAEVGGRVVSRGGGVAKVMCTVDVHSLG